MSRRTRPGRDAENIATVLRADIISGALRPGIRLRQEELAQRFATSRMPVRDGLRMLAGEGLVFLSRNRSARVAPLDADDCLEIAEMRAAAERMALHHAIPALTDRRLEAAARLQDEIEAADPARLGELNRAFHQALLTPCARPRLLAHVRMLHDLSERYVHAAADALDYHARSHREHRALLAACRRRDRVLAGNLVAAHILDAGTALAAWLHETHSEQVR